MIGYSRPFFITLGAGTYPSSYMTVAGSVLRRGSQPRQLFGEVLPRTVRMQRLPRPSLVGLALLASQIIVLPVPVPTWLQE